jgi:hypothetical protein
LRISYRSVDVSYKYELTAVTYIVAASNGRA